MPVGCLQAELFSSGIVGGDPVELLNLEVQAVPIARIVAQRYSVFICKTAVGVISRAFPACEELNIPVSIEGIIFLEKEMIKRLTCLMRHSTALYLSRPQFNINEDLSIKMEFCLWKLILTLRFKANL